MLCINLIKHLKGSTIDDEWKYEIIKQEKVLRVWKYQKYWYFIRHIISTLRITLYFILASNKHDFDLF